MQFLTFGKLRLLSLFFPPHDCLLCLWYFPSFSGDCSILLIVSLSTLNPVISLVDSVSIWSPHFSNTSLSLLYFFIANHLILHLYVSHLFPQLSRNSPIHTSFLWLQLTSSLQACFLNYFQFTFYLILSLPTLLPDVYSLDSVVHNFSHSLAHHWIS